MINSITTRGDFLSFTAAVERNETGNVINIRLRAKDSKNAWVLDRPADKIVPGLIKPKMTDAEIVRAVAVAVQRVMTGWADDLVCNLHWESL